jgi:hypothetical protein
VWLKLSHPLSCVATNSSAASHTLTYIVIIHLPRLLRYLVVRSAALHLFSSVALPSRIIPISGSRLIAADPSGATVMQLRHLHQLIPHSFF